MVFESWLLKWVVSDNDVELLSEFPIMPSRICNLIAVMIFHTAKLV